MPTGNLQLYVFDSNSNPLGPIHLPNVPLDTVVPNDIIQGLYQYNKQPSAPNAGGTTIWKMGRCIVDPATHTVKKGQPLLECVALNGPGNDIHSDENICVWEERRFFSF